MMKATPPAQNANHIEAQGRGHQGRAQVSRHAGVLVQHESREVVIRRLQIRAGGFGAAFANRVRQRRHDIVEPGIEELVHIVIARRSVASSQENQ